MTKLSSTINESIQKLMDLSDEMTNIEKTTSLTNDEVKELDEQLGAIDTRSSRKELREFAVEAGKLGKDSVDSVRKFVEEANMINVALGEDLGKDAVTEIMKLADIFGDSALDIGSAINSIGQASVATEAFQVDFLKRTAAIGKAVNITSKELLGYGAALEINGATAETSGTAMLNFFGDFIKKADEFGAIAGYAKGELRKLMDEKGTNAAFIDFLQHLDKGSKNTKDLLNKLEDMGIDGARGSNALLILAKNTSDVIEQQKVGAESAGSIIDEYDKRNNNAAAQAEKTMKKLQAVMIPIWNTIGGFFIGLGKVLVDNIGLIIGFGKTLVIGATGLLSYKAAVWLASGGLRVMAASIYSTIVPLGIQRAAALASATVTSLLAGNTVAAAMSFRLLTTALAANPIGLIAAGIAGLVAVMTAFRGESEQQQTVLSGLKKASEDVAVAYGMEERKLYDLLTAARDERKSKEERLSLIKRINSISPEFLGHLDEENIKTTAAKDAIDNYLVSFRKKVEAQAMEQAYVEAMKKSVEAEVAFQKVHEEVMKDVEQRFKDQNVRMVEDYIRNKELMSKAAVVAANEEMNLIKKVADKKGVTLGMGGGDAVGGGGGGLDDSLASVKAKTQAIVKERVKGFEDLKKEEYRISKESLEDYFILEKAKMLELRNHGVFSEMEYQDILITLEEKRLIAVKILNLDYNESTAQAELDIQQQKYDELEKKHKKYMSVLLGESGTFGEPTGSGSKKGSGPSSGTPSPTTGDGSTDKYIQQINELKEYTSIAGDLVNTLHDIQIQAIENELTTFENAQNTKRKTLDRDLKAGIVSQEQYDAKMAEIDEQSMQRQRELKEAQWKKNKDAAVLQSIQNGLMMVSYALASGIPPPGNFILAALMGGLAAVQTGLIANQPMPQFYQGGDTWVTGASDNRRYRARTTRSIAGGGRFSEPTVGLVGERGPEYVIPNYIYGDPKFANVIGALEAARTTRQYYSGGESGAAIGSASNTSTTDAYIMQGNMIMSKLLERLEQPIIAKTYFGLQEFHEADDLEKLAREKGKF
jgi:TP901 family phage tail tape measure protein